MACERYRDALTELAAGAEASADASAHLASCEACRAELASVRQALAAVDDELAQLRVAEPSPDLAARIRSAVAESSSAAPAWRLGWGMALAAASVVVAVAFVASRGPRPQPPASVADRAPAREAPLATPAPERFVSETAGSQPVASERHASSPSSRVRARGPEVLVPAGEAEALGRLAASLRRRSVTPDSLLVADLAAPLAELEVREIRPLEIAPLDPARDSGAE